jgi:hypothetical protein
MRYLTKTQSVGKVFGMHTLTDDRCPCASAGALLVSWRIPIEFSRGWIIISPRIFLNKVVFAALRHNRLLISGKWEDLFERDSFSQKFSAADVFTWLQKGVSHSYILSSWPFPLRKTNYPTIISCVLLFSMICRQNCNLWVLIHCSDDFECSRPERIKQISLIAS